MNPIPVTWCAAGALILAAAGFGAGWQVRAWKAGADQSAALRKAARDLQKAADNIHDVAVLYEGEKAKAAASSAERVTELRTIYREISIPDQCAVPDAARSVLVRSVDAANARAGGEPGAALSRAPASAAAAGRP